jgi:formate dehydrogenase iron-sulfur subunit
MDRRTFLKYSGAGVAAALSTCLVSPIHAAGAENGADGDYSMLYDATLCVGCRACQSACREANDKPAEPDPSGLHDAPLQLSGDTWTLIQLYEEQNGPAWSFVKKQCMHCLDPACVSACPLQALTKTAEGPVIYDTDICFGCRYCMVVCPFDVPKYQWGTTTPLIQKCDFCMSNGRLPNGEGPACVMACPTGALDWGERGEMLAVAHERIDQNPGDYVDHVYGEHEAGGTLALYLSGVPFEDLGFPVLNEEPLPEKTEFAMSVAIPGIIVGMSALMTGVRWMTGRREANAENQEEASS